MTTPDVAPNLENLPENEKLNALISEGVKGQTHFWTVASELVRSMIYLGSETGDIKTLADVKPLSIKVGPSQCVVVCISQASCAKVKERTPYFLAMPAAGFIGQLAPEIGLFVQGDTDAFVIHPHEMSYIKSQLTQKVDPRKA